MTYSFPEGFSPGPLKMFQHPAASSARGRLVSGSDAVGVAEDEFTPLSLQRSLHTVLSVESTSGSCFPSSDIWALLFFCVGSCKSISPAAPRAAPSQRQGQCQ